MSESGLSPDLFRRVDETTDADFYAEPRMVTHIDAATIDVLTEIYRERLARGDEVLDLMSSWISHLPPELDLERVAGLGMNVQELAANPRLDESVVQDLNADPELPYPTASFDAVLIAVSVQYLIRPVEVFASISRVLRPGGFALVGMSHRLFPTKAIAAFHAFPPEERVRLVSAYFRLAGNFEKSTSFSRLPPDADPLWVVTARRAVG